MRERERITKQDIDEFGATIGCPGCNAIRDNKRAQAHSDRCRMRIEECLNRSSWANIMEISITGQVDRWARQSNLSGGLSLCKADGWNLKNHSHLTVARHLREKTHTSMLVVTIKDGERGICSAALRELLRIVKDQIEERSVVIIVSNRESAIWRNASVKIVLQQNQLKFVDVEGMRVVTNSRCIAEQIKSNKVENVVMDGSKVGTIGRIEGQQYLKSTVMDGVRSGKRMR